MPSLSAMLTEWISVEKNEIQLRKMIEQVTNDKRRMLETIDNLDHHKREAVETTWTKVNGYVSRHHLSGPPQTDAPYYVSGTSVRSLRSFSQATSPNCSRQKVRTSCRVLRSRSAWAPCGSSLSRN